LSIFNTALESESLSLRHNFNNLEKPQSTPQSVVYAIAPVLALRSIISTTLPFAVTMLSA
jgi:hypothetical protein